HRFAPGRGAVVRVRCGIFAPHVGLHLGEADRYLPKTKHPPSRRGAVCSADWWKSRRKVMPTTLGGRLSARSRSLSLEALALPEVPDLLAGIRHAVPGVVLRVGDQLRLGAGATVNVALTNG